MISLEDFWQDQHCFFFFGLNQQIQQNSLFNKTKGDQRKIRLLLGFIYTLTFNLTHVEISTLLELLLNLLAYDSYIIKVLILCH